MSIEGYNITREKKVRRCHDLAVKYPETKGIAAGMTDEGTLEKGDFSSAFLQSVICG